MIASVFKSDDDQSFWSQQTTTTGQTCLCFRYEIILQIGITKSGKETSGNCSMEVVRCGFEHELFQQAAKTKTHDSDPWLTFRRDFVQETKSCCYTEIHTQFRSVLSFHCRRSQISHQHIIHAMWRGLKAAIFMSTCLLSRKCGEL